MGDNIDLNTNKGFNVNQLFDDVRYKLSHFLNEAGL